MRNLILPIAVAVAAAGCSSLTPTDDPVYLRITDIEARLMRVERVVQNESLIQLATEVQQLRGETAALRGEIESLRFETEGAAERQRDLYVDVDQRLQALEQAQSRGAFAPPPAAPSQDSFASTPPPTAPQAPARPAGTDRENYDAAFRLIEARRFPEAGRAFQEFLAAFPSSPLRDNAQYWLAETYYVQGQFQEAQAAFQKVIDDYPRSAKMPDALLKLAYTQDELGEDAAARATLQRVMREFSDTTAARLATERLARLSQ